MLGGVGSYKSPAHEKMRGIIDNEADTRQAIALDVCL